jgi:hypothetical protein
VFLDFETGWENRDRRFLIGHIWTRFDGEMLTKAAQKMSLEQKALVMHQVFEAIQEAPSIGTLNLPTSC